jgi:protein CWC15
MGRETKGGSRQYSDKDMASHTKLKFRQPGQTSTAEVTSADLRRELLIAERKAQDKKRKAMGLGPLPPLLLDGVAIDGEAKGEEGGDAKRRKMLESVVGLDRDDDDEDEEEGDSTKNAADAKGKGKAKDDDDE